MDNISDYVSERATDFESLDSDAVKLADEMIEEYKIEMDFSAIDLMKHVDFDSIRQEFRDDYYYEVDNEKATTASPEIEFNEIEDLFEKT